MAEYDGAIEAHEAGFGDTPYEGVFLQRGQTLQLSAFTISISEEGEIGGTGPTISTSIHMAPFWLSAAVDHCRTAEKLSHATNMAFRTSNTEVRAKALNNELLASMQALTSAAFAIDSLHAALLQVAPTPMLTKKAWRRNKTKRSRQIFETLRRAFGFGPKSGKKILQYLDQISNARDAAVHPPSKTKLAEKHSRLPVAVDPAYNMFRSQNAIVAVGLAIDLIHGAAKAELAKQDIIREKMASLLELVEPIFRKWNRTKAGLRFRQLQQAALEEQ